MPTIEIMTRGFVHIPDSPPESRWLRLRGPPVENINLAGGPTTQAEIWQMRLNRYLGSLLVEIWLNEYREGWSVGFSISISNLPYFHLLFFQLTPLCLLLGNCIGLSHHFSMWQTSSTTGKWPHITVPWWCLCDTHQTRLERRRTGRDCLGRRQWSWRHRVFLAGVRKRRVI